MMASTGPTADHHALLITQELKPRAPFGQRRGVLSWPALAVFCALLCVAWAPRPIAVAALSAYDPALPRPPTAAPGSARPTARRIQPTQNGPRTLRPPVRPQVAARQSSARPGASPASALGTAWRPLRPQGLTASCLFAAALAGLLALLRRVKDGPRPPGTVMPPSICAMSACAPEQEQRDPAPEGEASPLAAPESVAAAYTQFYSRRPRPPRAWECIGDVVDHGVPPPLPGLRPIGLREATEAMSRAGHNKGAVLCVRTVLYPGFRRDGLHVLVEDRDGDRMHLVLNHYARPQEAPEGVLPVGTRLALLEPLLTLGPVGPMLRCDNPQCAVRFRSEREWRAAAEGRPADPTIGDAAAGIAALLELSASHLAANRYSEAAAVATDALRESPGGRSQDRVAALVRRATCYACNKQYREAQSDCEAALELDPENTDARVLLAKGLLLLQRPDEALPVAEALESARPDTPGIDGLLRDIRRAIAEQQRGDYDLALMHREAAQGAGPVSPVHMDFISPDIELVEEVSGKGRGFRAKRAFRENELVMASRAFAIQFHDGRLPGYDPDATSGLAIPHIIHRLWADPECGAELYRLDAGSGFRDCAPPDSASGIVDVLRISRICVHNAFAGGDEWGGVLDQTKRSSGLWIQASYFNHSCTPNCQWMQVGDFMFIFATRPVDAGEELCLSYGGSGSFVARSRIFAEFGIEEGFECQCPKCTLLRSRPDLVDIDTKVHEARRGTGIDVSGALPHDRT